MACDLRRLGFGDRTGAIAELAGDDAARCERAGAALARLHQDESAEVLLSLLAAKFENLGPAGQEWCSSKLVLAICWR